MGRQEIFCFISTYYASQPQVLQAFMYGLVLLIVDTDPDLGHAEEDSNEVHCICLLFTGLD